jgi:hypothetical protein
MTRPPLLQTSANIVREMSRFPGRRVHVRWYTVQKVTSWHVLSGGQSGQNTSSQCLEYIVSFCDQDRACHVVRRVTPKDRDEVKRREVWECEGWVCDVEGIGVPSIFKTIHRVTSLTRMFPTLDLGCEEENTTRRSEVGFHLVKTVLLHYWILFEILLHIGKCK